MSEFSHPSHNPANHGGSLESRLGATLDKAPEMTDEERVRQARAMLERLRDRQVAQETGQEAGNANEAPSLELRLGDLPESDKEELEPAKVEESSESAAEFDTHISQAADRFIDATQGGFEQMLSNEKVIEQVVADAKDALAHARVGNISKFHLVEHLSGAVAHLSDLELRQQNALDGGLAQEVKALGQEAEELLRVARTAREQDEIEDETAHKTKKLHSTAEELTATLCGLINSEEDRFHVITELRDLVSELEHDDWGVETTIAQIGARLDSLEEAGRMQLASTLRLQGSVDELTRIR